jgi:hypothetical protein
LSAKYEHGVTGPQGAKLIDGLFVLPLPQAYPMISSAKLLSSKRVSRGMHAFLSEAPKIKRSAKRSYAERPSFTSGLELAGQRPRNRYRIATEL